MNVNTTITQEMTDFLFHEAELLNDYRHMEWLELLTKDIVYQVPLRVTLEKGEDSEFLNSMMIMDENYQTLLIRILRLETEYCWAEMPHSRTRHHLSNIRVKEKETDVYLVKSNFLLFRNRGDSTHYDLLSGERQDVVKRVDGRLMLAKRVVYLDQSVLGAHNVSFFF
ncbi:aromatic-ring-hydroxylating dioxygenase subunit beta [Neobacillus niacini]|uniref:aromatic-ring-hydroxylating dioxygenase subunit beta n=1 Tax=Neobacillus niacini TaxID=86668 RepID=UPI0030009E34